MIIKNSKTKEEQQKKPQKQSMATLRLRKDLQALQANKPKYTEIQFPQQNNLQNITIHINLQLSKEHLQECITPYNHTYISFSLVFPDDYPIKPPKLKCLHRIYHPNINYNGSVCLPLLREDWSPTVSLQQIIYGLIFILMYPNGEDALQPQIGDQMKSDYKLYEKIVYYTSQGRVFKQKQYDRIRNQIKF